MLSQNTLVAPHSDSLSKYFFFLSPESVIFLGRAALNGCYSYAIGNTTISSYFQINFQTTHHVSCICVKVIL